MSKSNTSFNPTELAQQVLESTYLMSIATIHADSPWVADVVFIHDEKFNIYWISKTNTRHSRNIELCCNVAATITQSINQGEDNIGLQLEGTAMRVRGNLGLVTRHLKKRRKLTPENIRDFLGPGVSWYKLTPTLIELIYEPIWGYGKQLVLGSKIS